MDACAGWRGGSGDGRGAPQAGGTPRARIIVILAYALAALPGLGSAGLWGIREKRVAACVADVAVGGHWLLPHLRDEPRLEKPPLPYWVMALTARFTGRLDEWILRGPCAVAGLVIIGVVFTLAHEAQGERAGLLAALFLCTACFFVAELREPSSDLFLACFTACALACWWRGRVRLDQRVWWWSAAGLCAGLAMLAKGPIALAVLGPPIVGLSVWQRGPLLPRTRAAWLAIVTALVVGLSWPIAVLVLRPDAWVSWVLELQIKLTTTAVRHREHWFYLLLWPQYLFPWSAFSLAAVILAFPVRGWRPSPLVRMAWLWFFGDLVIFSLAGEHKAYYLLPGLPGLAILAGCVADAVDARVRAGSATRFDHLLVRCQFLLLVGLGVGVAVLSEIGPAVRLPAGSIAGGLFALGGVALWWSWRGGSLVRCWSIAALVMAAGMGAAYAWVVPALDPYYAHRVFAHAVERAVPAGEPIYFVGDVDPSFWFYLGTRPPVGPKLAAPESVPPGSYVLVSRNDGRRYATLLPRCELVLAEQRFRGERWLAALCRTSVDGRGDRATAARRVGCGTLHRS